MSLELDEILTCREGSTPKITGTVLDETGAPVPDAEINSATLAVHDYTTGNQLRAAAAIAVAGGAFTAWLSRAETRIINPALAYEHRVVTVEVQYSETRYATAEAFVRVLNLRHVLVPEPEGEGA